MVALLGYITVDELVIAIFGFGMVLLGRLLHAYGADNFSQIFMTAGRGLTVGGIVVLGLAVVSVIARVSMAAPDPALIVGRSAIASRTPSAPLRGRLRRSLTRPLRYPSATAMGSVAEVWPRGKNVHLSTGGESRPGLP
jgi:hypothetical protein